MSFESEFRHGAPDVYDLAYGQLVNSGLVAKKVLCAACVGGLQ